MENELSKQFCELKLVQDMVITPVTVPLPARETVTAMAAELKQVSPRTAAHPPPEARHHPDSGCARRPSLPGDPWLTGFGDIYGEG